MGIPRLLALTGGESVDCDTFSGVFRQITVPSVSLQDLGVTQELQCAGRVGEAIGLCTGACSPLPVACLGSAL